MNSLALAPRLDLTEAKPLAASLSAFRDQPVTLDAGAVDYLGGLCLQVLLSAVREWRAGGQAFLIAPRSPAFAEALAGFGIDVQEFPEEQVQ